MLVFFNFLGAVWLVIGLAIAVGAQKVGLLGAKGASMNSYFFLVALIVAVLDLAYRCMFSRKKYTLQSTNQNKGLKLDLAKHWISSGAFGGNLMFLPAWFSSALFLVWFVFIVQL